MSEKLDSHRKPASAFNIVAFGIVRRLKLAIVTDRVLKKLRTFLSC